MNGKLWVIGICAVCASQAIGQSSSAPAPAPAKTLGASMGLTVFPGKGQNATVQSQDEASCYNWSKTNTGYDPANPPATAVAQKVEPPPQQSTGARARGAVRGAAAGAVVGEIADNDA